MHKTERHLQIKKPVTKIQEKKIDAESKQK